MKYFVPTLALGALSPPQTRLADKFGGLPWGLPAEKWPSCAECGNPQTHLATFTHSAERLDLGAEGRVVMIFQCGHAPNETDCETYEANSGANAVVFLNAHELGNGLTEPPAPGASKEIEMRVARWTEKQDLVTPELEPLHYPPEGLWYTADGKWVERDEAREAIDDSVEAGARLGSVPCWVQEPESIDPVFHFVAQLAMYYHFPDPIPSADAVGAVVSVLRVMDRMDRIRLLTLDPDEIWDVRKPTHPDPSLRGQIYFSDLTLERYGSGFDVEAAEFGDGGKGYLFIHPHPVCPRGLFFWQSG